VQKKAEIAPAKGKLGVLLVGPGAVSTTFIAGVEAIKKGIADPVGSLTQMGTIPPREANGQPCTSDQGFRAARETRRSGLWRLGHFSRLCVRAATHAGVLEKDLLAQVRVPLQKIKPMKAVFDQSYVKRLQGTKTLRKAPTRWRWLNN